MTTASERLRPLFDPVRIGGLELESRIVMPAMHTMFANADGSVSERLVAYHEERAYGGAALQILENSAIDWRRGRANGAPARIDANQYVPGLHELTAAVHAAGGRIATQPHHAGRQNTRANTVDLVGPVAPSPLACRVCLDPPEGLSEVAIEELIETFAEAVVLSQRAGFDAAEIHAAHGYLINQFASPYTNRRRDGWGGGAERRFRFGREVVRRSREAVGPGFPLLVRLNGDDAVPGGLDLAESVEFAVELVAAGADALHVSAGIYESMERIFMMHGEGPGDLLPLAAAVKAAVEVPVIAVGRLGHDPELAARAIAEGRTDLVAFGRPLIAEPRLPRLLREGRGREARPCVACNACVGELFDQRRILCVVNPDLGHERDLSAPAPDARGHRVVVVGGGPAGLEAAARFAEAGASVLLVEAADELGGQLRAAAVPAHKRPEFPRLLEFLLDRVERLGVEVQLGTVLDPASTAEIGVDLVVLATGPAPPQYHLGDRPTLPAAAVLTDGLPSGTETVYVLGATQVGLDTALWLREQGVAVTVVDEAAEPAPETNPILRGHLLRLAEASGVELRLGSSLTEMEDTRCPVVLAGPGAARYGRDLAEGTLAIGAAAIAAATLHTATASARRCARRFAAAPITAGGR